MSTDVYTYMDTLLAFTISIGILVSMYGINTFKQRTFIMGVGVSVISFVVWATTWAIR